MDYIFYNGKVLTGEAKLPLAEAVAIQGSKIAAVGENDRVKALKKANTEFIDLEGRVLLPGFNDSHLHLIGYAANKSKVDLSRCRSIEEVVESIKTFINENEIPGGEWVYGWGWNHSLFDIKKMPGRHDLDRASTRHRLAVVRTCCHILSANTPALETAGIKKDPPLLDGGSVETDSEGCATGILKEQAMQLVLDLIPPPDKNALKKLIESAGRDFLAVGLTSVQTDDLAALGTDLLPVLIDAYKELEAEGALPLRVNLQPLLMSIGELQGFVESGYHQFNGSSFFRIGPLKLLSDGSLGGKTAYMNLPYRNDPENRGMPVLCREELETLVITAHRKGMQVATHAIGDAAIEMVLEAYSKANNMHPRNDPRFRIVHASVVSPRALEMFKELSVIADIQPSFATTDHAYIDQNLGAERAAWSYRWKDFIRENIVLGGSSDCPVEHFNPLEGICAAVTRQDFCGEPAGGWYPDQRLTLGEAINIYTRGSAYCTFEEELKGTIAPGKMADLQVLSEDITQVKPAEIKNIVTDLTMVGGKIAYGRK